MSDTLTKEDVLRLRMKASLACLSGGDVPPIETFTLCDSWLAQDAELAALKAWVAELREALAAHAAADCKAFWDIAGPVEDFVKPAVDRGMVERVNAKVTQHALTLMDYQRENAALKKKIDAALALPEYLKRIGFEPIDGWRVVEAMRETLIGG